jgi:acetyl-CoA carboxylase biotin carboxyl carrier protein
VDIRKIKKLIELLEESSLTEIEIVEGEESVRLVRGVQVQAMPVAAAPLMVSAVAPGQPAEQPVEEQDEVPDG